MCFHNNNFTIFPLGPAIDANGGLEYLNLSWNHLRGKGGIAIGRGLRANCSLKTLNLSWNGFADEGAAAVGESLKENNTLTDLDLTNNRISTQGALALSKGIQVNNTLKILRFVKTTLHRCTTYTGEITTDDVKILFECFDESSERDIHD